MYTMGQPKMNSTQDPLFLNLLQVLSRPVAAVVSETVTLKWVLAFLFPQQTRVSECVNYFKTSALSAKA